MCRSTMQSNHLFAKVQQGHDYGAEVRVATVTSEWHHPHGPMDMRHPYREIR